MTISLARARVARVEMALVEILPKKSKS